MADMCVCGVEMVDTDTQLYCCVVCMYVCMYVYVCMYARLYVCMLYNTGGVLTKRQIGLHVHTVCIN